MHQSFSNAFLQRLTHFFEAIINLFIFLPYFFSVKTLLKTLFRPWKNITVRKTSVGFSMGDSLNRLSYNLISRCMGFIMRISILIFFLCIQILYVLSMPLISLFFIMLAPILWVADMVGNSPDEKKEKVKQRFLGAHLLTGENSQAVRVWFEKYYAQQQQRAQWWTLSNLLRTPPLARDWSAGYTPTLDHYTTDLTSVKYQASMKHVVGRTDEIAQLERLLAKSEDANAVIVGEEGVGKHTIVDAFAKKVYEGTTNSVLAYKRVLRLDMEKVLSEVVDHVKREHFFETLLTEAIEARNIILLINHLERYLGEGENHVDLSTSIEKYAKTPLIQMIGITTPFSYEKSIASNDTIHQLFTKIEVEEVTPQEALEILLTTIDQFEQRYQVAIPYETIRAAIEKSNFYITSIPFPEKTMQLIDNACIYTVQTLKKSMVMPDSIDKVLTDTTNTPTSLTSEIKSKLLNLETALQGRVVAQEEALAQLTSLLREAFVLREHRKKPLASLLFLGPTGVGKTETAKALADTFFDGEHSLIRFDMASYQTKNDILTLLGSPLTENPGLLPTALVKKSYGVLLLDEIEKADGDLLNIFLTMLDEGYLTDGFGKKVNCKNIIIIATSNAGSDFLQVFTPEFLNRFDGIVAYKPLSYDSLLVIARKKLDVILQQLSQLYKIHISVLDETVQHAVQSHYNPAFGARELERTLRSQIEDKIAKLIVENKVKEGDSITL